MAYLGECQLGEELLAGCGAVVEVCVIEEAHGAVDHLGRAFCRFSGELLAHIVACLYHVERLWTLRHHQVSEI